MNSAARRLHDVHAWVAGLVDGGLKLVATPPPEFLSETGPIQTAGSCTLENTLEADIHQLSGRSITYSWNDASYHRLRRAFVVGDNGQIFLPDGSFFVTCLHPQEHLVHRMKIRRPIRPLAGRLRGPVFHLTGRNHENRGHFLLQHLPRLLAARQLLATVGDYRILVAPGHARWVQPMIKVAGFDPARVIEGTQGTLEIEDLIHVPFLYGSNALSAPALCREIRDRAAALCPEVVPGRPLFISRRDAPDKRLLNEDEVIAATEAVFGPVEVFVFKGRALPEQIRAFHAAPLVIGAIGQGICNFIFAGRSALITLAPGDDRKKLYPGGHSTHLALVCGNPAVMLYNGDAGLTRGNWSFPLPRFQTQLHRLASHPLLSHLSRTPVAG